MIIPKWEKLPAHMKTEEVRYYYDILSKKKAQLVIKRVLDIILSAFLLAFLLPMFLIIAVAIKLDTDGPVFFRQHRVTQYDRVFRIFKFRSMVNNTSKTELTVNNDYRVTRVGKIIRRCKIDELGQLIDVLRGTMTFVGTRPEVPRYVEKYTPEMYATLLLPAGITSQASVYYKKEYLLLEQSDNLEETYVHVVLPGKMKYNLKEIENFSLANDIKVMFMTVLAVFGKNYSSEMEDVTENVNERA